MNLGTTTIADELESFDKTKTLLLKMLRLIFTLLIKTK
jgi:hypothetical protein